MIEVILGLAVQMELNGSTTFGVMTRGSWDGRNCIALDIYPSLERAIQPPLLATSCTSMEAGLKRERIWVILLHSGSRRDAGTRSRIWDRRPRLVLVTA